MKKMLGVLFAVAMVFMFVASAYAATCGEDGLVAYYPFNGNPNDESGCGNHGTLVPGGSTWGPTLCEDRYGNPDSAYDFAGLTEHILVDDSETLDITGPITISSWIMTDEPHDPRGIVNKLGPGTAPGRNGYATTSSTWNDTGEFWLGLWIDIPSTGEMLGSITSVTDGMWHHVVGTYDGTTMRVYVDGNLENSASYSLGMAENDYPLIIGWDPWSTLPYTFFVGKIDEVHIYNRALTPKEVCQLAGLTNCGYSAAANAEASTYVSSSLTGSGTLNSLTLVLIPMGAVILLRILGRKR